MQTETIDLSLSNPVFSRLVVVKGNGDKYKNIPTKAMPAKMQDILAQFYTNFMGEGEYLPEVMLLLSFNDLGVPSKLFGPAIYANQDKTGLVIKWGQQEIPAVLNADATVTVGTEKGFFAISQIGKYDELCVEFALSSEAEDIMYVLPLPVKLIDYKTVITPIQLKTLTKKENDKKVLDLFRTLQTKSGNNSNNDPVYSINALNGQKTIKLQEAKPITTSHGASYLLTIDGKKYWSHKQITALLNAGAIPNTLVFDYRIEQYSNNKGETKNRHVFENIDCEFNNSPEDLDISFLAE